MGGVTSDIDETDLQEFFYQFGEIAAINVVQKNSCAFVQFTRRESAEFAAQKCFGKLDIKVCTVQTRDRVITPVFVGSEVERKMG